MKMLKKKGLITILTLVLVCSLSFNVLGAGYLIDINAQLDTDIKIMVHGKKYEPKETDGSRMVPIIYKGRTYLPMRAVAEDIAGLKVTWDGNTRTAYLGDVAGNVKTNEIKYINVTPDIVPTAADKYYTKSRNAAVLTTSTGKVFEYGFTYEDPAYFAGYSLDIPTDFFYHKFKATIWADEVKDENGNYLSERAEIRITDENNSILKKFDLAWGSSQEIELDILDVKELGIWVSGSKSIIGEPKIGKP